MKKLFSILLLVALVVSQAAAQTPPGARPGASAVRVSLYVRGPADALAGLSYLQSGKALPLRVTPSRRSSPISIVGTAEFVVVREARDANGKVAQKEIGKVTLPAGAKEVLLLGAYKDGLINFLPINLEASSFPAGTLRVLNYSGNRVAWRLGRESKLIENGGNAQLGPYPASPNGRECSFAAQIGPEGNWHIFNTCGVVFDAQARFLVVLISPSQAGGEPEMITIRDLVSKPASPQS